jgi:hypothetical protein
MTLAGACGHWRRDKRCAERLEEVSAVDSRGHAVLLCDVARMLTHQLRFPNDKDMIRAPA